MNIKIPLSVLMFLYLFTVSAQCELKNKYIKHGEDYLYDLYFNYGLIDKRAGIATLKTNMIEFEGKPAFKTTLFAQTSGLVGTFITVKDTLDGIFDHDLKPLQFSKGAEELGDYTIEKQTYIYEKDGTIKIHTQQHRNGKFRFDEILSPSKCTYDMVNVINYARTISYKNMKKGDDTIISLVTGKKLLNVNLRYNGRSEEKMNDSKIHKYIELSIITSDDKNKDKDEIMKIYLSDDERRIPLRIDTKLKKGQMRVIFKKDRSKL